METPVVKSRGRPRKRRREEDSALEGKQGVVEEVVGIGIIGESNGDDKEDGKNIGNSRKRGRPPKKRAVEMRGEAMIGRYVLKKFDGSGTFLGKIVSYDSGLYRVDYEDGDCEDLDSGELREFVIGDERQRFVGGLLERKKRLDDTIEKRSAMKLKEEPDKNVRLKGKQVEAVNVKEEATKVDSVEVVCALEKMDNENAGNVPNDLRKIEVSEFPCEGVSGSDIDDNDDGDKDEDYCFEDDDDDISDDSCEYGLGWETRADTEIPAILPPELPPSSGTIGVPEEYVPHLFSVHGFLRTFSVHLFLSPLTLDDLVGCLKCATPNTLLDAIHVALLRVLRRHLESLASEGSQLASKCMRSIDWSLLDILTWPVYLVHYLIAMGHLNGSEWKGFFIDALEKEYCTLSIETKLTVLQILCDDALDAEEIRSEIDIREESEVGVDADVISSNHFDIVTRPAYPRNSKTSIKKDRDDPNLVAENSVVFNSKIVKSDDHNIDTDDVGEDGNRDECRLCGMEGMLICCDGCPSAYHSRCIGVNKLSIPDGEWFCPECTISRIGPPINNGTSLRGAEVFGVDSYAQLFLGTCSHLLVLKVSLKASSFVRYYNRNDVPTVLSVLSSSPYHSISYLGICQAISKYWGLPQAVVSPLMINQSMVVDNKDDYRLLSFQSHPSDENRNEKALYDYASSVCESSIHDASGLGSANLKTGSDSILLGAALQNDPRSMLYSNVSSVRQNATNMTSVLSEQAELSRSTQVGLAGQSTTAGIALCTSGYATGTGASYKNGVCFPETYHVQVGEEKVRAVGKTSQKKDTCLYLGSIFKPLAYVNSYVHGAFAASAAANFAGLSSDENQASEIHASDPRKSMAANVSLQAKAFSSAAVRFFWPSTIKKLVEIPRERCSWCFHCKAPVTSKKACLLNQAALNATRAEMKFTSGLRLEKIVDGGLYGIAAYTLFMEESLRGLTVGPFRSLSYRELWRKKVEQASACCEIKSLLLELERNLCSIALSSEWTKLVDTWMDESPVPQSAAASGPVQKRGPGKRKKHLTTPEAADDDPNDSKELCWWRGGKLAKFVFQRGIFPSRVLRKAARQGGSKKLPGIYYADGSDVPKRSRQFIWRAAVEMAKNASQLALQVRYLDQHIKWSDVVRPEQNPVDGKGPETEAFAFRNAQICDKRITENKILYGIVFGSQKHLSSRLMKSIIEKEERADGNLKYWLLEARVPLYLVKEYEEKAEKTDLSPPVKPDRYTKRQRRQLKASRKDIFVYLALKRDDLHVCPCASCHTDALLELAVTCNTCEGYCHKTCMLSSTELMDEDIEFRAICKQCSQRKLLSQSNNNVESPISPLAMQGQEFQNSAAVGKSGKLKSSGQHQNSTVGKSLKPKNSTQQSSSVGTSDKRSKSKSKSSKSKTSKSQRKASLCHGLIWKKKSSNDDGSDFRLRNIIFRGSSEGLTLRPECHLCRRAYSPNLMYILCEGICESWYHADAVKLDESKLPELFGFKCCKCRRIKSPTCPYADEDPKKNEIRKLRIRGPKEDTVDANSLSEATSDQADSLASTPLSLIEIDEEEDDIFTETRDPLLMSSQIEQTPDPNAEPGFDQNSFWPGPQKLPVRRHMQSEKDDDGLTWPDLSSAQLPTSDETKNFPDPNVEWDICNEGVEEGPSLNCDGLTYESDYEPQTYFSFTELLENDGDNQLEVGDASSEAWKDIPGEYSLNGFMEHCNLSSFDELLEAKGPIEPSEVVRCEVCQVATPAPDLACHMCGIQIHRHCSPWDDVFPGGLWNCGQCRGWS